MGDSRGVVGRSLATMAATAFVYGGIAAAPAGAGPGDVRSPGCFGDVEIIATSSSNARARAHIWCDYFVPYRYLSMRTVVNGSSRWHSVLVRGNSEYGAAAEVSANVYLPYQATYQACAKVVTTSTTYREYCTTPASVK